MRKSKEENKIEKIIRGLLKLPENRRCINCKSLGPQYVCTTFWTFVCTNCSGVHREFSHRVKSISMAKFTAEEVSALQEGGNERAKQVYFKTWDTQRNVFPDNSNIHKLRDFIKHVYAERRYTGETHPALVPRLRNIDDEEPYERRSRDGSEKPSFHERSLDRYGKFSFKEPRSFGYDRENSSRSSYGGLRSSSSRFGGRYQVDGARIAGRSATDMFTTADIKPSPRGNSPDPPVNHVREILGDNFPRLRVGDQPKLSERRNFYGSANNVQVEGHSKASNRSVDGRPTRGQEGNTQKSGDYSGNVHRRTASAYAQKVVQSSNQTSVNQENAEVKQKSGSAGSLVNFANFPPPEACLNQEQGTHVTNDGGNSSSSQNPANFVLQQIQRTLSEPPPAADTIRRTPAKNTLEYLLFELSSPVSTPSNNHSGNFAIEEAKESPTPTPSPQQPREHSVSTPFNNHSGVFTIEEAKESLAPSPQQPKEHSVITVLDSVTSPIPSSHSNGVISPIPSSHSNGVTDNQAEALSIVPSVAVPTQEKDVAATAEPSTTDTRSSERTELPADLFSSFNPRGPLPGWQMVPSHGMGFNMQYHPSSMPVPAFPSVTKSRNPFDTDDNTTQQYATNTMFPSMLSLQGGLPNISTPQDVSHTSTFGSQPQLFLPTHSSSYSSGAYMGHQLHGNMPPTRLQGNGGYGGQEGIPGSSNSNQHTQYTYPTNTSMNSFPKSGGNPFG